jgi:hypothetical protein
VLFIVFILSIALAGCAVTIPLGDRPTIRASAPEVAFQALEAIDYATSVNIVRRPDCFTRCFG